ncbi:MAG TPA: PAS domain-containing protein, partial [Clostridia bacterium]|nr:PAS domain-containing protein [Clostridia bacterium]
MGWLDLDRSSEGFCWQITVWHMSLLIPLAEKAFGSESKLMRSVIDNLPDYIFIKDTQSRIVFSNVAHARVLGHNHPDEVIGKTDFDWFPEDVARQFLADEQAVLTSGQPLNQEETVTDRQTGETRWLQTTKVPLRDEAGNIVGLVGIGRDISKRKRVESELRQAHDELEKRVTQRTAELTGKNAQLETANAALEQQMTERSRTEQALARERLLLRT